MTAKIKDFIKKETVLVISTLLAAATMLFVPPDREYLGYIDFRVLALLLCLMAVVAGFKSAGVFNCLTFQLLNKVKNGRLLSVTLVLLPFFSSMLVTNDVALIIFIPFTIDLLQRSGCNSRIIPVTVMQTVAANLGSMATPVGNPQNLFLYSAYNLGIGQFCSVTLPLTAVSLVLLIAAALPLLPSRLKAGGLAKEKIKSKSQLLIFTLLFVLCLFTVLRIIPYQLTAVITVLAIILIDRRLFKDVDFMLLVTFICFFVISENLGRIEVIRGFLQQLLEKNTLLASIGTSQVISNVPAAVLLSSFTDNWRALLAGVNIGGLGTPVASLASLITLKLYMKTAEAKFTKFLAFFTLANIAGLTALVLFTVLI